MRLVLVAVAAALFVGASPVAAAEPVFRAEGVGYSRIAFTLPESSGEHGNYAVGITLENRRFPTFCVVKQLTIGDYSWPFARRVRSVAYDGTPLPPGAYVLTVKGSCRWQVEIHPWDGMV